MPLLSPNQCKLHAKRRNHTNHPTVPITCICLAISPYTGTSGVVAHGLQGEGLVCWLEQWYVCTLHRGSNCLPSRAMDGRIMRHGTISSCQSAATSEIVKRCCSSLVSSAITSTQIFTFFTFYIRTRQWRAQEAFVETCKELRLTSGRSRMRKFSTSTWRAMSPIPTASHSSKQKCLVNMHYISNSNNLKHSLDATDVTSLTYWLNVSSYS